MHHAVTKSANFEVQQASMRISALSLTSSMTPSTFLKFPMPASPTLK